MIGLRNRKSAPQVPSVATDMSPIEDGALNPKDSTVTFGSLRATEIARWLDGACCRVLIDAVVPQIRCGPEPYVPSDAYDGRVAQWLALPEVGLLEADRAGYTLCYHLTSLGRLVIEAFLSDYALQRMYASRSTVHSRDAATWGQGSGDGSYAG